MSRVLRTLLSGLLVGIALSSFILAAVLISLLYRFAKDLAEVAATGEYIRALVVAGVLCLVAFWLTVSNSTVPGQSLPSHSPLQEDDYELG